MFNLPFPKILIHSFRKFPSIDVNRKGGLNGAVYEPVHLFNQSPKKG